MKIVIPSIRPEKMKDFLKGWDTYLDTSEIVLVQDGRNPTVNGKTVKQVMGKYSDLIYNFNDGVRNLGFAYVAKYCPEEQIIVSFDDDVLPSGNTLLDHLEALAMKVPITWMSTASEFTRGFPYKAREEAEVVLSHGVWKGVADWDAPTQLTLGNREVSFYRGVVPCGVQFPICAMNFAFKRKMLPYIYQAPMGPKIGLDRFADIWGGIEAKKDIDRLGWAAVTGYATVRHERASNVWDNLIKESKGLKMNENYGIDPYFKLFHEKRKRWAEFINKYL